MFYFSDVYRNINCFLCDALVCDFRGLPIRHFIAFCQKTESPEGCWVSLCVVRRQCRCKILSLTFTLGHFAPRFFAGRGQRDHSPDVGGAGLGTHREVREGELGVQWPRRGRPEGHPAGRGSPSRHHAAQSGGHGGSPMGKVCSSSPWRSFMF